MKNEPLISVVLPTYNVAQYLQQCLESVAAQTYRNIEVIIIIDGATAVLFPRTSGRVLSGSSVART